jgi:hypothetical protein
MVEEQGLPEWAYSWASELVSGQPHLYTFQDGKRKSSMSSCEEVIEAIMPGASLAVNARPFPASDSHLNRPDGNRRGLQEGRGPCNRGLRLAGVAIYIPHFVAKPYCSMRAGLC